jgi:hypothetical protein
MRFCPHMIAASQLVVTLFHLFLKVERNVRYRTFGLLQSSKGPQIGAIAPSRPYLKVGWSVTFMPNGEDGPRAPNSANSSLAIARHALSAD